MAYPCGLPLSAPRGQGGLPPTTVIRCTRGESAARVYAGVCMRAPRVRNAVLRTRVAACFVYSRRYLLMVGRRKTSFLCTDKQNSLKNLITPLSLSLFLTVEFIIE